MTLIQPVILSGGSGTRLWPASRAMYPKQLRSLTGPKSMLQETSLRLMPMTDTADDYYVICNEAHRFLVGEQLRDINVSARIVLEPEGRNTAPAVALAALLAQKQYPAGDSPILLIMPADHVIRDTGEFLRCIAVGEQAAAAGRIVTFGIIPTTPHTGYGYIESAGATQGAADIVSFVEKPDDRTAVEMFESKRFFWNAGIFMCRVDTLLNEFDSLAPEIAAACRRSMQDARVDAEFVWPDGAAFKSCPANSIDYAIMEKTTRGAMVPMDAGWNDVGSWTALHDTSEKDASGNAIVGDVIARDCVSSLVHSSSRLVTAIGLENMVVIEEKDAVLVVPRDKSQDVKNLVDDLNRARREETRLHREVNRPWGSFDRIDAGAGFQVKRLVVHPGAVLSLQKHARRSEHYVVVRGLATVTRDDEEFELGVNEHVHIPIGAVHRIANHGTEPVHIIEVQLGDYLGEDDIERLQDNYGREGTST